MAKLESTAINDLVAIMASRPLPPEAIPSRPSEEMTYVRDLPPLAGAAAVRAREVVPGADPWRAPVAAFAPPAGRPLPPPTRQPFAPPAPHPFAPPAAHPFAPPAGHPFGSHAGQPFGPRPDDTGINTFQVRRMAPRNKQLLAIAGIVVAGVAVGTIAARATRSAAAPATRSAAATGSATATGTAAVTGSATATATATGTVTATDSDSDSDSGSAPATATATGTASASAAAPSLVHIRLDSDPPGASLTLVDNGRPAPVGTTPLDVALDPSHAYDVVFALAGHPSRLVHVDPTSTRHVSLAFADAPPAAAAPAAVATTPAPAQRAAREPSHHERARSHEHAQEHGVLMVSTKPPCEILIDGRPTGLVTPQRALSLAPGAHAITLVNDEQGVRRTEHVRISPNRSTKLVRDLMSRS